MLTVLFGTAKEKWIIPKKLASHSKLIQTLLEDCSDATSKLHLRPDDVLTPSEIKGLHTLYSYFTTPLLEDNKNEKDLTEAILWASCLNLPPESPYIDMLFDRLLRGKNPDETKSICNNLKQRGVKIPLSHIAVPKIKFPVKVKVRRPRARSPCSSPCDEPTSSSSCCCDD